MRDTRANWKKTVVALACVALIGASASVEAVRLEVVGTDDWPADSVLDMGTIRCTRGDVVWVNQVTPTCPDGGRLKIRRTLAYSCVQAASLDGIPEPRLTGVASFSLNANFDVGYSGPVWGTWTLVPSETCDPQALVDPDEFWGGTWQGRRSVICSAGQCTWVGKLKWVGRGHGGEINGRRFKGTETIVTFSPLPVPYELLGICSAEAPCPPEGHMSGTIR